MATMPNTTGGKSSITWEEMARIFLYLNLMWDGEAKPSRLFGHLSEACGEVARERVTKAEC